MSTRQSKDVTASGYVLCPSDNGGFYWNPIPSSAVCDVCGSLIRTPPAPQFVSVDRALDFSYTHDGQILLSPAAADFLRQRAASGVVLDKIRTNKGEMFHLDACDTVEFDVDRRPVVFEGRCAKCNQYLDIFQAFPVYLRNPASVPTMGLVKTNLSAGHKERKAPSYIVGADLMMALRDRNFRGLAFDPVRS